MSAGASVNSMPQASRLLSISLNKVRIIRKHFNVVLERTVRELRGEPCLELEEFAPAKQEIVCSRSFGERVTDYEEMRGLFTATLRARQKNSAASTSTAVSSQHSSKHPLCPERALLR